MKHVRVIRHIKSQRLGNFHNRPWPEAGFEVAMQFDLRNFLIIHVLAFVLKTCRCAPGGVFGLECGNPVHISTKE